MVALSRRTAAIRVLTWTVQWGLIGGLAFGLVQAYRLADPFGSMVGPRLWRDILSYSGLAHGLVWMLGGGVFGSVCALLVLPERNRWRRIGLGVLAALLLATGGILLAWWLNVLPNVAYVVGKGLRCPWIQGMAAYLAGAAPIGYVIARCPRHRLSRGAIWVGRGLVAIAVPLAGICLAIQWSERPRLMAPTARWQQAPAGSSDRHDARPNVVLVVLDTQRIDRLGCYGYDRPTTPRLDAFAADARVYETCLSAGVWTLPSHASIFTGLFPCEHGANMNYFVLDEDFYTMAELLARLGYETVAFSNNPAIEPNGSLSQGFHRVIEPVLLHEARGNSVYRFVDEVLHPAGVMGTWLGAATARDDGAKFTNQLVARWLDERETGPFFLFINYMEPHSPYRPHLPHRRLFVPSEDLDASYRIPWSIFREFEFSLLKRDSFSPAILQLLSHVYDAETRVLDDYVGELLEILAAHVPLDDCLVIIVADHGQNLGEHHLLRHNWCVYDTLAHVPLIIRYPKRLSPGRTDRLVQTTDLLPTVMDAVHGQPVRTPSTFGRSLFPPPSGQPQPPPASSPGTAEGAAADLTGPVAVIELTSTGKVTTSLIRRRLDPQFDPTPFEGVFRAIRQGPWKYIVSPGGRQELYHVVDDPGELTNLIGIHRDVARRLAERLEEWLSTARQHPPRTGQEKVPAMNKETQERLRQLGYL